MHSSVHKDDDMQPPLLMGPIMCDGQRNAATALLLPATLTVTTNAAAQAESARIISIQCLYTPQHTERRPERSMVLASQQGEGVSWTLSCSHLLQFTWRIETHGRPERREVMEIQASAVARAGSDSRRPVHVSLSFDPASRAAAMHIQTDSTHSARTTLTALPPDSQSLFNADSPLWIGGPAGAAPDNSYSPFRGLISHVRATIIGALCSVEQSVGQLAADAFNNDVIMTALAARGWTGSPELMRPWPSTAEPIHSLAQLLTWRPGCDPLHVPRLRDALPRCPPSSPRAQVIHCHDMAYRSDIDGQHGSAEFHSYAFRWWKFIDLFVYFSHARIAVPPVAWIHAAHNNGVKILANFCTEWNEGEMENARLLMGSPDASLSQSALPSASKPMWQRYADSMVALAIEYAFDGWFLNIEAPLPIEPAEAAAAGSDSSSASSTEPDANAPIKLCGSVLRLCEFISYLRDAMHLARPGSLVIVYDSLLASSGHVKWQSKLSRENECFLDCADALFTDYHWKQDWPAESAKLAVARSSSASALDRRLNVFTGIDLFGRGTFGGGGFECWKALDVIRDAGTSIALFAPAWTYEGDGRRERGWRAFQAAENRLWVGETGLHELEAAGLGPVVNSSVDQCGWTLTNGGDGWKLVPRSEQDSARFAFIASHKLCLRHKRIDLLDHFSRDHLATNPEIRIQTEFAGAGPNVADAYELCVKLLAEDGTAVLDEFSLCTVAASSEYKQVTHTFPDYPAESRPASSSSSSSSSTTVRFVDWTDGGQDAEKWAGHFGTRIGESRVWIAPPMEASDVNQSRAKCIADYVERRTQSLRSLLPFVHSFNTGNGRDFFVQGRSVAVAPQGTDPAPWFNLSLQDSQTVLADSFIATGSSQRAEGIVVRAECSHSASAFDGGSCLLFECAADNSAPADASVLFDCFEFGVDEQPGQEGFNVDLSFVWATTSSAWRLALVLASNADESSRSSSIVIDPSSAACQVEQLAADWVRVRTRLPMALVSAVQHIRIRLSYDGSQRGPASVRLGQVRIVASADAPLQLPAPAESASSIPSPEAPIALLGAPSRLQCDPHFLLSSLWSARPVASFSFTWDEPKTVGTSVLSYDLYFGAIWRARVLRCMYFAPTLLRCSGRSALAPADSAASSSLASSSSVSRCGSAASLVPCPCGFRVVANLASGDRVQLHWRSA